MGSTDAVDTQKLENELLDDANEETDPSAGITSEKLHPRFVENSYLNLN